MFDKIDEVLNAQSKLIEPIIKNGTLRSFSNQAEKEINIIYKVREDLYRTKGNEEEFNNYIKENIDLIVNCFASIYTKLGEDSRSLPTSSLKELAIKEMESIMSVWKKIGDL